MAIKLWHSHTNATIIYLHPEVWHSYVSHGICTMLSPCTFHRQLFLAETCALHKTCILVFRISDWWKIVATTFRNKGQKTSLVLCCTGVLNPWFRNTIRDFIVADLLSCGKFRMEHTCQCKKLGKLTIHKFLFKTCHPAAKVCREPDSYNASNEHPFFP